MKCTYCKGIGHTVRHCGTHLNIRAICATDEALDKLRKLPSAIRPEKKIGGKKLKSYTEMRNRLY